MGINIKQFYRHIIVPTVERLEEYDKEINSQVSRKLLTATFCHESNAGTFLKQLQGPALGVYQIEPNTLMYLKSFIEQRTALRFVFNTYYPGWHHNLEWNVINDLSLATALARVKYWTIPEALPGISIEGLANYWGKYYQTDDADMNYVSEKEEHFIRNYTKHFIDDKIYE